MVIYGCSPVPFKAEVPRSVLISPVATGDVVPPGTPWILGTGGLKHLLDILGFFVPLNHRQGKGVTVT